MRIDFQFDTAAFDLRALPFKIPYPVPFKLFGDETKVWLLLAAALGSQCEMDMHRASVVVHVRADCLSLSLSASSSADNTQAVGESSPLCLTRWTRACEPECGCGSACPDTAPMVRCGRAGLARHHVPVPGRTVPAEPRQQGYAFCPGPRRPSARPPAGGHRVWRQRRPGPPPPHVFLAKLCDKRVGRASLALFCSHAIGAEPMHPSHSPVPSLAWPVCRCSSLHMCILLLPQARQCSVASWAGKRAGGRCGGVGRWGGGACAVARH